MKRIPIAEIIHHKDKEVQVAGWVDSRRDHGKLVFLDIRDASGLLQVVFRGAVVARPESVVRITGTIVARPDKMKNPDIVTGDFEMKGENCEILSEAKTLPFEIDTDGYDISEELRWKYRYLDMRRERVRDVLRIRHALKQAARVFLTKQGFTEVDTPILTKSTPEGARDFLVPSRKYPGKFYALPQSPQQYKQLLMVAGIEKYFQFARAFRDEDLRQDRGFEFDQLDIEMSFVEQEDILQLTEELIILLTETVAGKTIQEKPFPRLSHEEAMKKYKTDKPDLRKSKDDQNLMAFVWIVDFPMFEKGETRGWGAAHHPFTAMHEEDIAKLEDPKKIGEIRAKQYDLVLNGHEIFGGSIRTTDPEILTRVFGVLGHPKKEVEERFGHLLEAFSYGVPPHGGIAGFDRFLMALLNEKSIREVIPFPTTSSGLTSVMDAPSEVDEKQLKELHIRIVKPKKE